MVVGPAPPAASFADAARARPMPRLRAKPARPYALSWGFSAVGMKCRVIARAPEAAKSPES